MVTIIQINKMNKLNCKQKMIYVCNLETVDQDQLISAVRATAIFRWT
jgi:hypothetical protein